MNKKAEGRASSLVIALVLGLSLIMWFSTLVTNMVVDNDVSDVPEFQAYQDIYNDQVDEANNVIGSIESNETGKGILAKAEERFEDNIFRKVFKSIQLTFQSTKIMTRSVTMTDSDFFEIPPIVKTTILTIFGLAVAFLVLKAWWRFKEV